MRYEFNLSDYASAKQNAVKNLCDKTHYVDDDTLRFFRSRIVACYVHDNGRLLSIIETLSLDMHHTKRGYRFVIFDVTGKIVSNEKLEDCVSSKAIARKRLHTFLDSIDAKQITLDALAREKQRIENEISEAIENNKQF